LRTSLNVQAALLPDDAFFAGLVHPPPSFWSRRMRTVLTPRDPGEVARL
jgi:hypothetical protein